MQSSEESSTYDHTRYVGLSNQGATCYLNSLLQTLYMTPEFRYALYQWDYDSFWKEQFLVKGLIMKGDQGLSFDQFLEKYPEMEGKFQVFRDKSEKASIARQLQLLFLRLQLSDEKAVSTEDLTKSFQWDSLDAFTQHDVQELMRVFFDEFENVMKGTAYEELINVLYQGTMKGILDFEFDFRFC